jgi:hypothetical protein
LPGTRKKQKAQARKKRPHTKAATQPAKTTLFAGGNEGTGSKEAPWRFFPIMETARAGASPAPDMTVTVAPFRAWRDWRLIVAEIPTRAAIEL